MTDSTDSPDCLPILLSIICFYARQKDGGIKRYRDPSVCLSQPRL